MTTAINNIFSSLSASIDTKIYTILDNLVFINTDIFADGTLYNIFGSNNSGGIILICNSLLSGFLIYYAISLLLSYLTFSQIQRPSQFIFKLILCLIALNSSQLICYGLIFFTSSLSTSIRNLGNNLFDTDISFATLLHNLNIINTLGNFNLFTFDGLVKSLITFGFLTIALTYSLRYIMIKVLILICPFAILSLSIDKFSWIFKSWIKLFLSSLFLQILVSIILLITFSLKTDETIFSQLLYIGSIYALIKANTFIRDFMGGLSTDVNVGLSNLKSIF